MYLIEYDRSIWEIDYSLPYFREDPSSMLKIEWDDVFGSIKWSIFFIRRRKHCCHQPSCACSRYYIKIICDSCIWSIYFLSKDTLKFNDKLYYEICMCMHLECKYLKFGFKKRKQGARNDATDTTTIDAKNSDEIRLPYIDLFSSCIICYERPNGYYRDHKRNYYKICVIH